MEDLRPLLPPGARPCHPSRLDGDFILGVGEREPRYRLYARGNLVFESPDRQALLEGIEAELRYCISEKAPRHIFVHAGVVAWQDRAIVIPGASCSGKTSLVHALVQAGATYLSDEYAPLDAAGRVHPYPRPLSLRQDGSSWPQRFPAEAIGGRVGRRPMPLGLVLACEYRPGSTWEPRSLSPGEAVLAMLAHTVPVRLRPEQALSTLTRALDGVTALQGVRGDASEIVSSVLQRN